MNGVIESPRSTLAFITTSPYQVAFFLRSHLSALPADVKPIIFTSLKDSYSHLVADMDVKHVSLGRSPWLTPADVRAGLVLARTLRTQSAQTVVTLSPKAGFVGQMAALMAGVPTRAHIFTGQVWADLAPGPKRALTWAADALIGRMATHLAADSRSQAAFLQEEGISRRGAMVEVPHPPGSIRGVDLDRFHPRPVARPGIRDQHQIPREAFVFLQLGRLTRSKGVPELVEAFRAVRSDWRNGEIAQEPILWLAGPDEDDLTQGFSGHDGIKIVPFTEEPELLMAAADVLVLASHREGFGSTIIEAAACSVPAIASDIVGVRDAIDDGQTGWMVPPGDPGALRATMLKTLIDSDDRLRRGAAARTRAAEHFDARVVSSAYARFFTRLHGGES